MVLIPVLCPHCHSDQIIKGGKTKAGQQRYKCQNTDCPHYSFQRDLLYKGRAPAIKEQIVDMSLNGSGIRDTARVLKISPTTVINTLKKKPALTAVNQPLLNALHPDDVNVVIERVDEAEVDEMWSYVEKKTAPRWLWHAIDHQTGKVLAYVFGRRQDQVFVQLKRLLAPFGIRRYDTDYWGAYTRHLDPTEHHPGKWNMQQIERKHLTLRTRIKRLARKTICFSRSIQMHDIVIGLFVNRYEFGLPV